MNNGVYALPGFMAPAAKNWKSQLLTNEDGSVKLCVYVGKPGTKVYYSLGIPGWNWGFIKDAQYFIDKGYPQEVIDEVSKFADYLEEEVTALPEGTVIPDIIINGWPLPITESPIEGKVYWILNIPKFVLPAGDTEVQISANGKLLKYTITRPDFSIHHNTPGYTSSVGTPGGGSGGSSGGGLTAEERILLNGAAQRGGDNTFTASNTFTGEVDMSTAQVTPPSGWNVGELTAEQVQAVVPMAWGTYTTSPSVYMKGIAIGDGAYSLQANCVIIGDNTYGYGGCTAIGYGASSGGWGSLAAGREAKALSSYTTALGNKAKLSGDVCKYSIAVGSEVFSDKPLSITIGAKYTENPDTGQLDSGNVTHPCTTEGTGSITIGAGANTLNNGDTESSNSVTIGCKASNKGADSVVIGATATTAGNGNVIIGAAASSGAESWIKESVAIGKGATVNGTRSVAIRGSANGNATVAICGSALGSGSVVIGGVAKNAAGNSIAVGNYDTITNAPYTVAIGYGAKAANYGATVIRSTAEDGTYTQLYFSGANTPLANTYENGEAMMGYVVRDKQGNVMVDAEGNAMVGTQKLSVLFPNNRGENAFTPAMLSLDEDWTPKPMFHPFDLDMPQEEPQETEEYTPLPVWPIVEPEIEDINLINAE